MEQKIQWIKYLSPLMGILFCPVTILFFWSILPSPIIDPEIELIEKAKP
tara:strand:+ start:604 stop:750 length:147 start_codon:yes stop_codon:yes gene_type:complete